MMPFCTLLMPMRSCCLLPAASRLACHLEVSCSAGLLFLLCALTPYLASTWLLGHRYYIIIYLYIFQCKEIYLCTF